MLVGQGAVSAIAAGTVRTGDSASEILSALDEGALAELLESLSDNAKGLFGGDFLSTLRSIVNGEYSLDYSGIFAFIMSLLGTSLGGVMWLLATVIAVAVLYAAVDGLKSRFSSESVAGAVHIASMISVLVIVATTTYSMIDACRNLIGALGSQMSVLLPMMLSVMAALGATQTSAVYQPILAIMSGGIMQLLTTVLIPLALLSYVFTTVGSVSGQMRLSKLADFVLSMMKWMLGMSFFVLCAFMSVQGITASVYDNVTIRTAKLALGKYLPIIGNYLSEGMNLILSGGVIVKNALGYAAIILLLLTFLPVLIQLIVYSLALKLSAAVTEPLGNETMSNYLSKVSNLVNVMIAIVCGAAFIYFIFALLVIMTGNISL